MYRLKLVRSLLLDDLNLTVTLQHTVAAMAELVKYAHTFYCFIPVLTLTTLPGKAK